MDQVTAEVEAHLDPASGVDKSWLRNASLAWVKLGFENASAFSDPDMTGPSTGRPSKDVIADFGKITISVKFLQQYGDATTAYNDLKPFIERLDSQQQNQFIARLEENTIYSKVNDPEGDDSKTGGAANFSNQDVSTPFPEIIAQDGLSVVAFNFIPQQVIKDNFFHPIHC